MGVHWPELATQLRSSCRDEIFSQSGGSTKKYWGLQKYIGGRGNKGGVLIRFDRVSPTHLIVCMKLTTIEHIELFSFLFSLLCCNQIFIFYYHVKLSEGRLKKKEKKESLSQFPRGRRIVSEGLFYPNARYGKIEPQNFCAFCQRYDVRL